LYGSKDRIVAVYSLIVIAREMGDSLDYGDLDDLMMTQINAAGGDTSQ
jgi:hypothetical protein